MAESVPQLNKKRGLKLPVHGNERTMNLNQLILANITESAYFRVDLVQYRQFEEVVDEIYYRVQHLEPWEKVFWQKNFEMFFWRVFLPTFSNWIIRARVNTSRDRRLARNAGWPIPRFRECQITWACAASDREGSFPPLFAAFTNFGRSNSTENKSKYWSTTRIHPI